jgi:hypothetical protein
MNTNEHECRRRAFAAMVEQGCPLSDASRPGMNHKMHTK